MSAAPRAALRHRIHTAPAHNDAEVCGADEAFTKHLRMDPMWSGMVDSVRNHDRKILWKGNSPARDRRVRDRCNSNEFKATYSLDSSRGFSACQQPVYPSPGLPACQQRWYTPVLVA